MPALELAQRVAEGTRPREPFLELEPGLRLVAAAPRHGADARRRAPSARCFARRARRTASSIVDCGTAWAAAATSPRRGDAHPLDASRRAARPSRVPALLLASDALPTPGRCARDPRRRSPRIDARRASVRALRRLAAERCDRLVLIPHSDARRARRARRPLGRLAPDAHRHRTASAEEPVNAPRPARGRRRDSQPARSPARPPRALVVACGAAAVALTGLADDARQHAALRLRRRRATRQQRRCASRSTTPGSPAARCSAPGSLRDSRSVLALLVDLLLAAVLAVQRRGRRARARRLRRAR